MSEEAYDYVIIGAGSAGCVLANRLTQDGTSVVLVEAGKWDRDPLIHVPMGIGKIFPERRRDWGYFMQPDAAMGGRGVECARGKVVGGSSSINVMAYVRGYRGAEGPTRVQQTLYRGRPAWRSLRQGSRPVSTQRRTTMALTPKDLA